MTDNLNDAHVPGAGASPVDTKGAVPSTASTVKEELSTSAGAAHAGNVDQAKITPIPNSGSRGA